MSNLRASWPAALKRRLLDRAALLTALLMLVTVSAYLGPWHWAADLLTHFRALYILVGMPLMAIFLAARSWKWAGLGAGVVILNSASVLPLYCPPPAKALSEGALTIMEANVLTSNTQYERLVRLVKEVSPDVLVLLEIDDAWLGQLAPLKAVYPYTVEAPQSDNFGMVVMSKTPYIETSRHDLAGVGVPAIAVRLEAAGMPLNVLAVHTVPPSGKTMASLRNAQLHALAEAASMAEESLVVIGDLNTTPWNSHFKELLRASGLEDARRGYDIQSTWPTMFRPFAIPIDHCLLSRDLQVTRFRTLRSIGSDHFPLLVTVRRTR